MAAKGEWGVAPDKGDIERMMEQGMSVEDMAASLNISKGKLEYWKQRYGLTRKVSEVDEWVESHKEVKRAYATLRERSKRTYYYDIREYCFWAEKQPQELWNESWEQARDRLIDFRVHLEERGISANTIGVYIAAIRRFYEYKNIVFKGKFITNGKAAQPKRENEKELIEINQLRELLEISDVMEKAMYMCQYQSGLSANELCNLQVKDVGKLEKNGTITFNVVDGVIMLKLTREKTNVRFITFLGHDAIQYLEKWLELRQSGKVMRNREISEGAVIKSNDDYLFVAYAKRTKKWGRIDTATYSRHLLNAVRKLGWISDENLRDKGRLNVFRPHALRMTFSEKLKHKAKIPWDIVEVFLGHKFGGTDAAYVKHTEDDLRKAYKEGEPFISLTPIESIVTDDQYKQLRAENEQLKQLLDQYEQQQEDVFAQLAAQGLIKLKPLK